MKKNIYKIFLSLLLFFMAALPVLAADTPPPPGGSKMPTLQNARELVNGFAPTVGYVPSEITPEQIVGRLIAYVLSFLGVIFLVLMVYGGWLWLTASGNEEQVTKAKELIKQAVIGLVIVFTSYLVSYFVLQAILKATIGQ